MAGILVHQVTACTVRVLGASLFMLASTPLAAQDIASLIDLEPITAGYAGLINFALTPELSSATYWPDANDDAELDVHRFPIPIPLPDIMDWPTVLTVTGVYQTLDATLDINPTNDITAEWDAYGAGISLDVAVPLDDSGRFTVMPRIGIGYAHLNNEARFYGLDAVQLELLYTNSVFQWQQDAIALGGSVGLTYRESLGAWSLTTSSVITWQRLMTIRATTDTAAFDADAGSVDFELKLGRDLGISLFQCPLGAAGIVGYTRLFGERLFADFFEVGLEIDADIDNLSLPVSECSVGATYIFGAEVSGYSITFDVDF